MGWVTYVCEQGISTMSLKTSVWMMLQPHQ